VGVKVPEMTRPRCDVPARSCIKQEPPELADEILAPGLVSQSVLLWDGVRLEMKRIVKGHTRISLLPKKIIVNEAPLYVSAPEQYLI